MRIVCQNALSHPKLALRREPGYPAGEPAPCFLQCFCGKKVPVPVGQTANVTCSECQMEYTATGWVVSK